MVQQVGFSPVIQALQAQVQDAADRLLADQATLAARSAALLAHGHEPDPSIGNSEPKPVLDHWQAVWLVAARRHANLSVLPILGLLVAGALFFPLSFLAVLAATILLVTRLLWLLTEM